MNEREGYAFFIVCCLSHKTLGITDSNQGIDFIANDFFFNSKIEDLKFCNTVGPETLDIKKITKIVSQGTEYKSVFSLIS